jgi:hypothetical protein
MAWKITTADYKLWQFGATFERRPVSQDLGSGHYSTSEFSIDLTAAAPAIPVSPVCLMVGRSGPERPRTSTSPVAYATSVSSIGVKVLDHIIIGKSRYVALVDDGYR